MRFIKAYKVFEADGPQPSEFSWTKDLTIPQDMQLEIHDMSYELRDEDYIVSYQWWPPYPLKRRFKVNKYPHINITKRAENGESDWERISYRQIKDFCDRIISYLDEKGYNGVVKFRKINGQYYEIDDSEPISLFQRSIHYKIEMINREVYGDVWESKVFESVITKNELVDKIKYFSQYLETYLNDVNKFTTSNLNLQFSYGTILYISEILKLGGSLNYDSPDGLITAVAQQFIIWSEYFTKNYGISFKNKLKLFKLDDNYLIFTDGYKQSNKSRLYQQEYNHLLYGYVGETIRYLITGTIWDIPESKEFTDEDKDFILDCLSSDYDNISSEYISKASDMIDKSKTLDNSRGYIIRIPLIGNDVKIDYDDDFIHRLCSYFGGVLILKSGYSLNQAYYKLCLPFYK